VDSIPLVDTFDPTCLEYAPALQPYPDAQEDGQLVWYDLGWLPPAEFHMLILDFVAVGECDPALNTAGVNGAVDDLGRPVPPVLDTAQVTILPGPTPTVTPTPTRTPTITPTPTATVAPTLIPVVQLPPWEFSPAPPAADPDQLQLEDVRLTQGLEWDASAGVSFRLIAERDTLLRFNLYTESGAVQVEDIACEVLAYDASAPNSRRSHGMVRGNTDGSMEVGMSTSVIDASRQVDCWIPGSMLQPAPSYWFVVYVNDTDGNGWQLTAQGGRYFYKTAEYLGWFMMIGYWDPATWPAGGRQPVDPFQGEIVWTFLGQDMPTMHRLWPLRSGIEYVQADGSNAHSAGLRAYLSPMAYRCGDEEQQNPHVDGDPHMTCATNMRGTANTLLHQYNLETEIMNAGSGSAFRETMHWGTVVEPFDRPGGGQSCWSGHKVAGCAISIQPMGGAR